MIKNIFLVFVLLFVSFSLVACKNEREVKKNDSMELLIQETQKRSKIEKNKDEIQNLINSISTDLEKNYESREIDIKPDYLL